jgi:hypothetical protein
MTATMADKRLRLSFDARTEVNRRAVHVAASLQGVSHNDILNDLIERHLGKYIALAQKELEDGDPPPRKRKGD